jgi:hypothetical protein
MSSARRRTGQVGQVHAPAPTWTSPEAGNFFFSPGRIASLAVRILVSRGANCGRLYGGDSAFARRDVGLLILRCYSSYGFPKQQVGVSREPVYCRSLR